MFQIPAILLFINSTILLQSDITLLHLSEYVRSTRKKLETIPLTKAILAYLPCNFPLLELSRERTACVGACLSSTPGLGFFGASFFNHNTQSRIPSASRQISPQKRITVETVDNAQIDIWKQEAIMSFLSCWKCFNYSFDLLKLHFWTN